MEWYTHTHTHTNTNTHTYELQLSECELSWIFRWWFIFSSLDSDDVESSWLTHKHSRREFVTHTQTHTLVGFRWRREFVSEYPVHIQMTWVRACECLCVSHLNIQLYHLHHECHLNITNSMLQIRCRLRFVRTNSHHMNMNIPPIHFLSATNTLFICALGLWMSHVTHMNESRHI